MAQWVENNLLQWVESASAEWADITTSGILVDIDGIGAYVNYASGYKTVWANSTTLFIGSANDGIKRLDKEDISCDVDDPTDLRGSIINYLNYPDITSDNIRYLHGNDNLLLCITDAGIDIHKMGAQAYRSTSSESNAYKGFMTSTGRFYYTVTSGVNYSAIHICNKCICDWSIPDTTYVNDGTLLASGVVIRDIFVTEGTSYNGVSNTIFAATSSGVYVIDEGNNDYDLYINTGTLISGAYNILEGLFNDYVAIWSTSDASLSDGRLYVSSTASFNVVDLATSTLANYYTRTFAGGAGQLLTSDDIVDTSVV